MVIRISTTEYTAHIQTAAVPKSAQAATLAAIHLLQHPTPQEAVEAEPNQNPKPNASP
jgi:hypothetical protein